MGESVEGQFAVISTKTAVANTTKWKRRIGEVNESVVHYSGTRASLCDNSILCGFIFGEAIQGEGEWTFVAAV